jgi:hypothetical protein
MLRKIHVQYVHVVSIYQGLLQHINLYLFYLLLYMHLSHVRAKGLTAITLNPNIFIVLDFRCLKRNRSWSGPGSTHTVRVRVRFGNGSNDTMTNSFQDAESP